MIKLSDVNGTIHTWKLNIGKVFKKYDIEHQCNKHSDCIYLNWTRSIDSVLDYIDKNKPLISWFMLSTQLISSQLKIYMNSDLDIRWHGIILYDKDHLFRRFLKLVQIKRKSERCRDIEDGIRQEISRDLNIPLTKIFSWKKKKLNWQIFPFLL